MGLSREQAHCAVRFSLCESTTQAQIDGAARALQEVLVELESAVRFLPCK
jgi:cysteine sulfinate desulfinase/cysteine desulfurase-like protein